MTSWTLIEDGVWATKNGSRVFEITKEDETTYDLWEVTNGQVLLGNKSTLKGAKSLAKSILLKDLNKVVEAELEEV